MTTKTRLAKSESEKEEAEHELEVTTAAKIAADAKATEGWERIKDLEARLATQTAESEASQAKLKDAETANADLSKQVQDAQIELSSALSEVSLN